jgi:hypothetical protein
MCSVDEYWARVRQLPLHRERESADGEAVIHRTDQGEPVRVTKPETLVTDEKREAAISFYESFYKPAAH